MSLYTNVNFLPIAKSNFGGKSDSDIIESNELNTNAVPFNAVNSPNNETKVGNILRKSVLSRVVLLNQFDAGVCDATIRRYSNEGQCTIVLL